VECHAKLKKYSVDLLERAVDYEKWYKNNKI